MLEERFRGRRGGAGRRRGGRRAGRLGARGGGRPHRGAAGETAPARHLGHHGRTHREARGQQVLLAVAGVQ